MSDKGKKMRRLSEVDKELIRRNYADSRTADLAQVCDVSVHTVNTFACRKGLQKSAAFMAAEHARLATHGAQHRFTKGIVPWNTGTHYVAGGRSAETRFKKGQRPVNEMPVGSYRVNESWKGGEGALKGCVEYKFSDAPGPYTNRWIAVHRKVWIDANGPVPAGHVIAFKPGCKTLDPEKITLDILECITRAESARRNPKGLAGMPKALADVHRARGQLSRAIKKKAKDLAENPDSKPTITE